MKTLQSERRIKKARRISIDCDGPLMKLFWGRVWLVRQRGNSRPWALLGRFENQWMRFIQLLRPPLEGFWEVSTFWKKNGKELYLLTSRYPQIIPATEEWLKRHQFSSLFIKRHYNLQREIPWIYKENIIRNEEIDLHIDDDPKTLQYLSQAMPKKTFLYLNSYSNQSLSRKNVITKYSWGELLPRQPG